MSPANIIKKILIEDSLAELSTGLNWPSFLSHQPAKPDNCVTLYDTGSIPKGRLMSGPVIEHDKVQLMIRAVNYGVGYKKADDIIDQFDTILRRVVTIGSFSCQVHSINRTGTWNSIGTDPDDTLRRELFTINISMSIRVLTGN